jgi:hypothetical protein
MIAVFSGICDEIQNQIQRDTCYYSSAEKSGDASSCVKIKDESIRKKCEAEFTSEIMDPEKCVELVDIDLDSATGCWENVINRAIETNDIDLCMMSPNYYLEKCIRGMAVKTGDVEVCDRFSHGEIRGSCIINFYAKTGVPEPKYCEGLQDNTQKLNCFYIIGANKNDASYCEKLNSEDAKKCVEILLEIKTEPGVCNTISDVDLMDYCIERAAVGCDSIIDEVKQAECWAKLVGGGLFE